MYGDQPRNTDGPKPVVVFVTGGALGLLGKYPFDLSGQCLDLKELANCSWRCASLEVNNLKQQRVLYK